MNDDITWRQENGRGFDPKVKFFVSYRNEAPDPFVQLYYDILSRFHVNDYNKALEGMSDKMRQIIIACSNEVHSKELPTTLMQADLDHIKENIADNFDNDDFPF